MLPPEAPLPQLREKNLLGISLPRISLAKHTVTVSCQILLRESLREVAAEFHATARGGDSLGVSLLFDKGFLN
jgi:hypothetical protein